MDWQQPVKPFDLTYTQLIKAILNGFYPPGSYLPGERQLAETLGVTRPTLREVMQRLAADGWLEIQQGKSTRVKDIWREGSLNTLGTLVRYIDTLPPDFISNLLQVRSALAPTYASEAVKNASTELERFIEEKKPTTTSSPTEFATFDWELHYLLTVLSGNPIFTLILNGFSGIYPIMAERYFQTKSARDASLTFYLELQSVAKEEKSERAMIIVRQMMDLSIFFWQDVVNNRLEDEK